MHAPLSLQVGDYVLTKDQNNPDAPAELQQVTEVYRHEVGSIRTVSIQDATGNVEALRVTDDHPFYVANVGWVAAKDLQNGTVVTTASGAPASSSAMSPSFSPPPSLSIISKSPTTTPISSKTAKGRKRRFGCMMNAMNGWFAMESPLAKVG